MSKGLYEDMYCWCIYAVISRKEEIAFIAKSRAKNPMTRFYEHIKGENKWTADDFGPNGTVEDAELIILESIECSTSMAYRHTVAWGHFFEEQKFIVLTTPRKSEQFDYLKPETQKIYDRVCAPFSLSEVLDRKVIHEWRKSEPKTDQLSRKIDKSYMTQLNLRVRRSVAESFRDLCKQSEMSQNNMLALLLAPENQSRAAELNAPWEELNYQKAANTKIKEENEVLRKRAAVVCERERRYRKVLAATANAVIEKAEKGCSFFGGSRNLPTVAPKYFKKAKRAGLFQDYQYPKEDGVAVVTLKDIAEGKRTVIPYKGHSLPPALFVCGETEDGNKVRFRWYPRKEGLGISPRDKVFSYLGAKWLVGYMMAQDGAMDLIAIVPLDLLPEDEAVKPIADTDKNTTSSLEEKIKEASIRSGDNSYF